MTIQRGLIIPLFAALSAIFGSAEPAAGQWFGQNPTKTGIVEIGQATPVALEVTARNGSISVEVHDEPVVRIEAKIRAKTKERLGKVAIQHARDHDGGLSIEAVWPDDEMKDGEGVSFRVLVPGTAGVTLETRNGSISASGLDGPAVLDTSNGSIKVDGHTGDVSADTSNGTITVEGCVGSVHADTSNGSITVGRCTGAVSADTSNGSITVALAPESAGPVNADTSNGAITIEAGPSFAGDVEMSVSRGRISITAPAEFRVTRRGKRNAAVHSPNAGDTSRLDTSNGAIVFRVAG